MSLEHLCVPAAEYITFVPTDEDLALVAQLQACRLLLDANEEFLNDVPLTWRMNEQFDQRDLDASLESLMQRLFAVLHGCGLEPVHLNVPSFDVVLPRYCDQPELTDWHVHKPEGVAFMYMNAGLPTHIVPTEVTVNVPADLEARYRRTGLWRINDFISRDAFDDGYVCLLPWTIAIFRDGDLHRKAPLSSLPQEMRASLAPRVSWFAKLKRTG